MGLDMYLSRRIYIGNQYKTPEEKTKITFGKIYENVSSVDINKLSYVTFETAYWRKDNHIHRWFVEKVQNDNDDCGEYYVGTEKLKELVDLCKATKDYLNSCEFTAEEHIDYFTKKPFEIKTFKVNEEKMEDLLPTQSGFFFGDVSYGSYYLESLNYTIKALSNLEEGDYYYSSSW